MPSTPRSSASRAHSPKTNALDARLVTTHVLYYMPKHPMLLQSFVWQTHDRAPRYPRVMRFLDFWRREIDAAIHSVNIACPDEVGAARWRRVDHDLRLH